MYWVLNVIFPIVIIVVINLILKNYIPKITYLFSILPFAITIYFFIEFQDSLNSMESVYEFIWGATAFGVGIISFLFTKLMERVTRL